MFTDFLLCILLLCNFQIETSSLTDRLVTEGSAGWKKWENLSSHIKCVGQRTELTWSPKKGERRRSAKIEFATSSNCVKNHITHQASGSQSVVCANPRYAFVLKRDSGNVPFVLTNHSRDLDEAVREAMELSVLQFVQAPWVIAWRPLGSMVTAKGFKITDATMITRQGHQQIKVSFDFDPASPEEVAWHDSWVVVDPNQNWAIQAYECKTRRVILAGSVEYGESKKGEIPVRRVVRTERSQSGESGTETHFEFDRFEIRSTPEKEFTLPAFGLPELADSRGKDYSDRTGLVFLLLAVVVGAVAFILRRYAQRNLS